MSLAHRLSRLGLVALSFCALTPGASSQQFFACGEVEAYCFADGADCPCGNDYVFGGCANQTGEGGILYVNGAGTVASDSLIFTATQLPALTTSLFVASRTPARLPFNNGLLCLDPMGSKILRLGAPQLTDVDGTISVGPGVASYINTVIGPPAGVVDPGSTWYFQNYYRDLDNCNGVANTTNAIRVQFAPSVPAADTWIGGRVFYDYSKGGVYDVGLPFEAPIPGWKIELQGAGGISTVFTDDLGRFEFIVPRDGASYDLVSIAPPPGYIPLPGGTRLPTGPTLVQVVADVGEYCIDLGQLQFVNTPELARDVSFWICDEGQGGDDDDDDDDDGDDDDDDGDDDDDDGESLTSDDDDDGDDDDDDGDDDEDCQEGGAGKLLLQECDPLWRELINQSCLRTNVTNPNGDAGTLFTVSLTAPFEEVFQEFAAYLNGPVNDVLAYELSKRFIVTVLNARCGVLQETVYIDRNNDGVLVNLEEMILQTTALLCDPCAANTGPGGDPVCRAMIEQCLSEWSGINSDGGSIYTRDSSMGSYATPY